MLVVMRLLLVPAAILAIPVKVLYLVAFAFYATLFFNLAG